MIWSASPRNTSKNNPVKMNEKNGIRGNKMKNFFALILIFSLLTGCDNNQEANTSSVVENTAPVQTDISMPISQPIVEYIWQKEGPDFSEEKLNELVIKWNARIDAGKYDMTSANILRPRFEDERFDFIWVLVWPSQEARDAAWSDWNENQASDWRNETTNVFGYSPENVYGFEPVWGYRTADFDIEHTESETYEPNFSFCSFNEGHDQSSLDAMKSRYNAWLEETNDDSADPYAYVMLEPQESTEGVDFVWLDLFLSMEDKQSGEESWAGTDLEKDWNEMAKCQTYQFSGTVIRR